MLTETDSPSPSQESFDVETIRDRMQQFRIQTRYTTVGLLFALTTVSIVLRYISKTTHHF